MNRRNYLWHVSEESQGDKDSRQKVRDCLQAFLFCPDLKIFDRDEQENNENKTSMSHKLESLSVNIIKANKKDIIFIYFWPDTEALCINSWNILQNTKRKKLFRQKVY